MTLMQGDAFTIAVEMPDGRTAWDRVTVMGVNKKGIVSFRRGHWATGKKEWLPMREFRKLIGVRDPLDDIAKLVEEACN